MFKTVLLTLDLAHPDSWSKALPVALDVVKAWSAQLHVLTVLPEVAVLRTARGAREAVLWAAMLLACGVGVVLFLVVRDYAADRWSWPHAVAAAASTVYFGVASALLNWAWARWVTSRSPRVAS